MSTDHTTYNWPKFLSINEFESGAWISFARVVKTFLGNKQAENDTQLKKDMPVNFNRLDWNVSVKISYLNRHFNRFSCNIGDLSEEQDKRIHQSIKTMEVRYQEKWDANTISDYCWNLMWDAHTMLDYCWNFMWDAHTMSDYCWNLMRECAGRFHSRKSNKGSFLRVND